MILIGIPAFRDEDFEIIIERVPAGIHAAFHFGWGPARPGRCGGRGSEQDAPAVVEDMPRDTIYRPAMGCWTLRCHLTLAVTPRAKALFDDGEDVRLTINKDYRPDTQPCFHRSHIRRSQRKPHSNFRVDWRPRLRILSAMNHPEHHDRRGARRLFHRIVTARPVPGRYLLQSKNFCPVLPRYGVMKLFVAHSPAHHRNFRIEAVAAAYPSRCDRA